MDERNWFVIISTFLGGATFIVLILWWMIRDRNKRAKKWENLTHPKNAREMTHYGYTPNRGEYIVVISPYKWVIVRWDKSENSLKIITRPDTFREKDPVKRIQINWMVKKEKPPVKVRWQDYMVRQVM